MESSLSREALYSISPEPQVPRGERDAEQAVVTPPLTLEGIAYDPEEGELEGAALVWSSDLDGPLGTGDTVWDVDLSEGQHTLTLSATDSQGLESSASITVTVGHVTVYRYVYLPLVLRKAP